MLSVYFVQFKIDAASHITDIACSETTPALLASALKKTLQKSEPYWKRGKGRASQWILQPVLYDYHTNAKLYSMISTLSKEEYSGLMTIRK